MGSSHTCSILIDVCVCVFFPFILDAKFVDRCVCVCVFFPFILDAKFVECTSRGHTGGRSHSISHPPSFCGACVYFFSSTVESNFVYYRFNRSPLVGQFFFFFFFFFLVRKKQKINTYRDSNSRTNVRGGYEVDNRATVRGDPGGNYLLYFFKLKTKSAIFKLSSCAQVLPYH